MSPAMLISGLVRPSLKGGLCMSAGPKKNYVRPSDDDDEDVLVNV